jgi:hypothetical protein
LKSVLEQIVPESCVALFGAFGVTLRPARLGIPSEADLAGDSSGANLTAAAVTFLSTQIRGTLVIVASFDLVASCRPAGVKRRKLSAESAGDWIYVRDWSKELSNELLGRIKRQIISYGLSFELGMPTALTGPAVRGLVSSQTVQPIRFVAGADRVSIWFDVKLTPDAESRLTMTKLDSLHKEGDVVLF